MTWANFKDWLDANILYTDSKSLEVRVKYGVDNYRKLNRNPKTLTSFCDSLEATLDKNEGYHLFAPFSRSKTFRELFPFEQRYWGSKTNLEKVSGEDYYLLEKLFNEWKESLKVDENYQFDLEDKVEELEKKLEKVKKKLGAWVKLIGGRGVKGEKKKGWFW